MLKRPWRLAQPSLRSSGGRYSAPSFTFPSLFGDPMRIADISRIVLR